MPILKNSQKLILRKDTWANRANLIAYGEGLYYFTDLQTYAYYDGSQLHVPVFPLKNDGTGYLVPSLTAANAATYSQTGTTITVAATGHGLPQNNALANGSQVYLVIGSGLATSGWYTNFQCSNANTFTCTSTTSQTTTGTINTNTSETTITPLSVTLPGGILGIKGNYRSFIKLMMDTGAYPKTLKYYLGGTIVHQPVAFASGQITAEHQIMVSNCEDAAKQIGAAGGASAGLTYAQTSAFASASVDTTADQTISISCQLSTVNTYMLVKKLIIEVMPPRSI